MKSNNFLAVSITALFIWFIQFTQASQDQIYLGTTPSDPSYYVDLPAHSTNRIVRGPITHLLHHKDSPSQIPCRMVITYPTELTSSLDNRMVPVIVYLGGFIGLVPIEWYADLNRRMAYRGGKGAIVISLDLRTFFPADYFVAADYVDRVVEWVLSASNEQGQGHGKGLYKVLPDMFAGRVNTKSVFLASHSSGAQSIMTVWDRRKGSNIDGMILLDPVDAMGEYQTMPFVLNLPVPRQMLNRGNGDSKFPPPTTLPENPEKFVPLSQPFMIFKSGLCGEAAVHLPPPPFVNSTKWNLPPIFADDNLWPACCPRNLGPDRFWQTLSKAADLAKDGRAGFIWDYKAYGHCDILDDRFVWVNRLMRLCKSVVDDTDQKKGERGRFDLHELRKNVAALTNAFVDMVLEGDGGSGEAKRWLSQNFWTRENVTVQHI